MARKVAITKHINSEQFQDDLIEVSQASYLMSFIEAIDLAAKFLPAEDVKKLKDHDNYSLDAKKLANIMAKGLKTSANLAKEKQKFNDWLNNTDLNEGTEVGDAEDQAESGIGSGNE